MEFARTVIDALDAAEIDYLIGGAVAVWHMANSAQRVIWMLS